MMYQLKWRQFFLVSGVVWLLQGLYSAINTGFFQAFSGNYVNWLAILIYSFTTSLAWWLFTLIIMRFVVFIESKNNSRYARILIHFVFGILIACLQRLLDILLTFNLIKWTNAVEPDLLKIENFFGLNYARQVGNGILIYFILVGIIYGYLYYLRSHEYQAQKINLQSELSKLRIENLKYQLQPHFLFNSLQSVSTLIHRDAKSADRALGDLGDMLRYSIKNMEATKVTLGDELFYLQKYIDLQQTRYGDRLDVQIIYDEAFIGMRVPSFIFQPIVENSIKHVVEKTGQSVKILIKMQIREDQLEIICRDNGESQKNNLGEVSSGIGLTNLKERIMALYGPNATFESSAITSGYETKIILPIHSDDD